MILRLHQWYLRDRFPIFSLTLSKPSFLLQPSRSLSLIFLFQMGFGLAGPYPRVQSHFPPKAPSQGGAGSCPSSRTWLIKSRRAHHLRERRPVEVLPWRGLETCTSRFSAVTCYNFKHKRRGPPQVSQFCEQVGKKQNAAPPAEFTCTVNPDSPALRLCPAKDLNHNYCVITNSASVAPSKVRHRVCSEWFLVPRLP